MPYLSRSDWGAVPPVRTVPVSKRLKGVCLHYMGFPVRTEDPVRLAQSIQRNHMAPPKSWWDLAYSERGYSALPRTFLAGYQPLDVGKVA